MCETLQVQSSMASAVCLQRSGGLYFFLVDSCITGLCEHQLWFWPSCESPWTWCSWYRAGNPLKIWLLSLAARWPVMEAPEFRWELACLGKNVVIFCTLPAWSTAQLEATGEREGHVYLPLQVVLCGMFISLGKSGSCFDGQWVLRLNLGLVRSMTEHKLTNNRNLYMVLINEVH